MPRSGSTLTDLMLDGLPGHVAVGELFYLWRNGVQRDNLCSCGAAFSRCPFWDAVGEVAFGGWSGALATRVLRLQDEVDRTSRIPLLLSRRGSAAFRAALAEYDDVLGRLYRAIRDVSGERVVVDSSKRPSLAYVLRGARDVDLRVVHVLRDPRGVAYSFSKVVPLPAGASHESTMPRSSTLKVARRWNTVNASISALRATGVPLVQVRYEDLVAHPQQQLRRVAALRPDLPLALGDLSFVEDGVLRTGTTHVVVGGRVRLGDDAVRLRLDEAWRREMPGRSRRAVSALTAPARAVYGYR
ncbi:sulfotransferase domain-containing protein [uncultured Pseudokineococcus sp.]|uniref:sulfotransferase domain-containing protein n=1 Tax=uncultured Pseudokineococcus sp. TaxID=1642928 RepID=UPI00262A02E7|nr:sulfotransferase domain-containing protein [uncultured Pseudokineococcus sp.]